jgi:hypothetical protein
MAHIGEFLNYLKFPCPLEGLLLKRERDEGEGGEF